VHSQESTRVLFENNAFIDVGSATWGGAGNSVLVLGAAFDSVSFNHNTLGFSESGSFMEGSPGPYLNFALTNNILTCGKYGFHENGKSTADGLLEVYLNPVVTRNVMIGCSTNRWGSLTAANFNAADPAAVGFTTWAADAATNESDNLALLPSSPYYNLLPSDPVCHDLGVNWATLQAHIK
jgi:hypothetical protein